MVITEPLANPSHLAVIEFIAAVEAQTPAIISTPCELALLARLYAILLTLVFA